MPAIICGSASLLIVVIRANLTNKKYPTFTSFLLLFFMTFLFVILRSGLIEYVMSFHAAFYILGMVLVSCIFEGQFATCGPLVFFPDLSGKTILMSSANQNLNTGSSSSNPNTGSTSSNTGTYYGKGMDKFLNQGYTLAETIRILQSPSYNDLKNLNF